jgi:hypothetical protein
LSTCYLYNPSKSTSTELSLAQSWTDIDLQEQWALSADELALLPGMTDTGRLAFAVQLKFMEIHGRFPERHDEIDPAVLDWLATQVGSGSATDGFVAFELDGRQGRRQRRTIRGILGIRPTTGGDRQRLSDWLANDVLPFDPQARHGRDLALEWGGVSRNPRKFRHQPKSKKAGFSHAKNP